MAVDLHTHSTFSDGTLTPTALVDLAASQGVSILALTDHDTVEGVPEALERGRQLGVEVVSGLEIGCIHRGVSYHILGYWIDHHNVELRSWLRKLQQGRRERNRKILQRLQGLGIDIDEGEVQQVSGCGQTGRPHIARLLVHKGVVADLDQAFRRYLRKGAAAWASRFVYSAEETIAMIHLAGGVAVLAHPLQGGISPAQLNGCIGELATAGLDGLELYYPSHTKKGRRRLHRIALQYDLALSGGSDFHGDNRPGTRLCRVGNGCEVSEELVSLLGRRRFPPAVHRPAA